jgi:hypothetical protein
MNMPDSKIFVAIVLGISNIELTSLANPDLLLLIVFQQNSFVMNVLQFSPAQLLFMFKQYIKQRTLLHKHAFWQDLIQPFRQFLNRY